MCMVTAMAAGAAGGAAIGGGVGLAQGRKDWWKYALVGAGAGVALGGAGALAAGAFAGAGAGAAGAGAGAAGAGTGAAGAGAAGAGAGAAGAGAAGAGAGAGAAGAGAGAAEGTFLGLTSTQWSWTLGGVGAVGSIGSGVGQAYSAREQGKAEERAAKQQSELMKQQANIEQENAKVAITDRQRQFRQMLGQGRAAGAASGMMAESQAIRVWEQDLAGEAAYDSWKIALNGARGAWGYRAQASQTLASGRNARRLGNLSATSSLVATPFNAAAAGLSGYRSGKTLVA